MENLGRKLDEMASSVVKTGENLINEIFNKQEGKEMEDVKQEKKSSIMLETCPYCGGPMSLELVDSGKPTYSYISRRNEGGVRIRCDVCGMSTNAIPIRAWMLDEAEVKKAIVQNIENNKRMYEEELMEDDYSDYCCEL